MMKMRRQERAVTDWKRVLEVVQNCDCCPVAFNEADGPYIVPMNFGFEAGPGERLTLYFHGASAGKKLELIRANPSVGFEMDTGHGLISGIQACSCSFLYQSVMGKGKMEIVSDLEEKKHGLAVLMRHYLGEKEWIFPSEVVEKTMVFRLEGKEWSCKEHRV